jgi:hypothetical protein
MIYILLSVYVLLIYLRLKDMNLKHNLLNVHLWVYQIMKLIWDL